MSEYQRDKDEALRYILGELTAPAQEEFEARYFADQALLDELGAVRAELLDTWVQGELTEAEWEKLAHRLQRLPALRAHAEFAQDLQRAFAKQDTAPPPTPPGASSLATAAPPSQPGLVMRGPSSRKRRWALAISLLLLLSAGWWWLNPSRGRAPTLPQTGQATPPLPAANGSMQAELLPTAIPPAGAVTHSPTPGAPRDRKPVPLPASRRGTIVSFVLSADLVRDVTEPATLTLPAGAHTLRLQLELPEPATQPLRAELQTVAGEAVWLQAGLRMQKFQRRSLVVCEIPAAQLEDAAYHLRLRTPDQTVAAEYFFRSRRQ